MKQAPQILIQADLETLKDAYKEAQQELINESFLAHFSGVHVGATTAAEILGITKKTLQARIKKGLICTMPREARNLKFELKHLLEVKIGNNSKTKSNEQK